MQSFTKQHSVLRVCLLYGVCSLVVLSVSGETRESYFESRSGVFQSLRTALGDLAGEGRTYLGKLAGEQTVLSVQKAFSQVLGVVAEGLATGLNVVLQYMVHFLQAAGVSVSLPVRVTSAGVIFVVQWIVVAILTYWIISLTFQLLASTLRRALWLLKISAALFCFVLILRDHSAGSDTMAIRLGMLVLVCVLLGVGSTGGGGSDAVEKTARLEEQVRILERRLREMERWRGTEE